MMSPYKESLSNFKVIVAFNRRDYFRTKFSAVNTKNYMAAVGSGIANSIFTPVYGLASVVAQFIVLTYGVYLITEGSFTIGLLVGFLAYVNSFYNPLRQIAALWANLQLALSAWNRISTILGLESTLKQVADSHTIEKIHATETAVIRFNNVHFRYGETEVLHDVSFNLEKGKTYALVGPTGGGKTTTASLIARLYDPTEGTIHLNGQDIRSYTALERTHKIGFILQEPFLFTGTVRENILYGNTEFKDYTNPALEEMLRGANLTKLIERFEKGLDTLVGSSETMSLGERQLIAFIRAVIRRPEILILDEATANIDTVTEELLEEILKQLPKETTKVIIAHRLNTIENADEIFFVNDRKVVPAGSLDHAVEMLLHNSRKS